MKNVKYFIGVYALIFIVISVNSLDAPKNELDKVIEDEITDKLSKDLLQSIEKKFQIDLEKSVDMVLAKIKMLLHNGTSHIQDRMVELQSLLHTIRAEGTDQVNKCLLDRQNETSALAEKTLHQMVVCGYALIGHDPAQAVTSVLALKNMINEGVKPLYEERKEIYSLLKVCGHDHESLKKVIKCVISKSTVVKSAMMDITSKLIAGVVDLTKLMAHGAMHEACLIEVVKTTEDEAFKLINKVKSCVVDKSAREELQEFLAESNETVFDKIELTKPPKPEGKIEEGVKYKSDDNITKSDSIIQRILNKNVTKENENTKLNPLQKNIKSNIGNNFLGEV